MQHRALAKFVLMVVIAGFNVDSFAEQSSSFGDYVVHYNALTTDQIEPSVARPESDTGGRDCLPG